MEALDAATQTEIRAMATSMLWRATGQLYGLCEETVLPCVELVCSYCDRPFRTCGCRTVPELPLPGPVYSIVEVVIDGTALADTAYRVDDWRWLVRVDGSSWPTNADPTDEDAFAVTYQKGVPPPSGAGLMVGELTCEVAKAICNDETCRLPRRVRQVTRQGVRIDFDPGAGFGLPLVDTWVENTNRPLIAGAVHSPDVPQRRRTTWQAP